MGVCFLHGRFISPGNVLKVDNLPNGVQVVRADVFVGEIVSVLPHVDTEERRKVANDGVLIGARDDRKAMRGVRIVDKPSPSRTLYGCRCGIELSLERVEEPHLASMAAPRAPVGAPPAAPLRCEIFKRLNGLCGHHH